MFVFYRGKENKLHKVHTKDTETHIEAIQIVEEYLDEQGWVYNKPVLAEIIGGKK